MGGDPAGADASAPDLIVCVDGRTAIRHAADGAFVIGRDRPPADVTVEHPAVSRLHLRLVPGRPWHLIDYESRNGVFADGNRIDHSTAITDGMTVYLADPEGVAVTFHYVHAEDITVPSTTSADPAGPEVESDRSGRVTDELRAVIADLMELPAVDDHDFARVTLQLLRRLVHLREALTALAATGDEPDAAAYLTCVGAMYDGLLIRMSACA